MDEANEADSLLKGAFMFYRIKEKGGEWYLVGYRNKSPLAPELSSEKFGSRESAWKAYRHIMKEKGKSF